ncbi:MAG TPA: dihydroxyacetone kinase subunit DhaL [Rectinemataceae bacterium]|nr:dihydroxyacetone kinase subunit DhaL [Rectinemataceae bacterium]
MKIDSRQYMEYIARVAKKIEENKDYVTELDSVTGDGDHWANMDMGFRKLVDSRAELETLPIGELFKKLGMLIMSAVGGSSGVLYGSAYIKASQIIGSAPCLDLSLLCAVLDAELQAIMARGNAKPGYKTMIDSLSPAVDAMKAALAGGVDEAAALEALKRGAIEGMNSTKAMEAVKGRATYQSGKGVGHLDPGAVTMCYQLETLADFLRE